MSPPPVDCCNTDLDLPGTLDLRRDGARPRPNLELIEVNEPIALAQNEERRRFNRPYNRTRFVGERSNKI